MDRRIDERFRKPRRTKGTPFYVQRNYWAGGVIALGGLTWILMELSPGFARAKSWLLEYTKDSDEYNTRLRHMQVAWSKPILHSLLTKAKEKAAYKNEPEPESWFFKFFMSLQQKTNFTDEDDK